MIGCHDFLNVKSMQKKLYQAFMRYVAITSQSDANQRQVPSTAGQRQLAELLRDELIALGLSNVMLDEYAIVTACLPSNVEGSKSLDSIGFIAHLDTVDVNLSPDIFPQLIENYDGNDICLNAQHDIYLRTDEHPEIRQYIGDNIICSDGTSVLGADDKAAISSIMVAIETLIEHDLPHGDIHICFVPDEEIGLRGVKKLDLTRFPVDYAYTLDCCEIGEVVYQTFNAGTATVEIKGITAHPMSAKGVLVNPTQVAVDMVNLLDRLQVPENTEDKEGYIWAEAINSNQASATLKLNIRDHDQVAYEAKKHYIEQMVALTRLRHPRAKIDCHIEETYGNINDARTVDNEVALTRLYEALERQNITPKTIAMRGGTDGSYLSSQGIFTPNFFTGAHNFHSNCEFLPMRSFEASCQTVIILCNLVAERLTKS